MWMLACWMVLTCDTVDLLLSGWSGGLSMLEAKYNTGGDCLFLWFIRKRREGENLALFYLTLTIAIPFTAHSSPAEDTQSLTGELVRRGRV